MAKKNKSVPMATSAGNPQLMLWVSPENTVYNSQNVVVCFGDGNPVSSLTMADMVLAYNKLFGAGYTREQIMRDEFKGGIHAVGASVTQIQNGNGNHAEMK